MAERIDVFISSTSRDLPLHRKEAMDACLSMGMFPIMMEHLPASDSDAIQASLEMVDQASIYVGIFAWRYGYIPTGYEISITEMEYNRAIERGLPLLIFVMHENHVIKAQDVEQGDGATKLSQFKKRLLEDNVVNFFRSPEDLRGCILHSLVPYQDTPSTVHRREGVKEDPAERIANSSSSTLRVIAGPGTGKTYSLIRRAARLLKDGIEPENILIVTFTRMAAGDLIRELNQMQIVGADKITKGTLHSFCLTVLMKAEVFLQTGRNAGRILMAFEERFILEDLKYDHKGKVVREFGNIHKRRKYLKAFEAAWARDQTQIPGTATLDTDRQFQNLLLDWLRFHQGMLLSEITPETLKYLKNNPASDERSRFQYVLVDEYQDLNKAEQALIDLLGTSSSLMIVGDEDQSIYESFRYAHPEGIVEFSNTHSQTEDIPLNLCRRCPSPLLDLAKSLISHNQLRQRRDLYSVTEHSDADIHIVQWVDMDSEAAGIARFLHDKISCGEFTPGQILILSPRRQFGQAIRDQLQVLGQPVESFFNEEIFDGNSKKIEEADSQEAFLLLSLLTNIHDRVALRCWLGIGSSDLGASQYSIVYQYCRSNSNLGPLDVLQKLSDGTLVLSNTGNLVARYELLRSKLDSLEGKSTVEIMEKLFPQEAEWAIPFREVFGDDIENLDLPGIQQRLQESISQPELPTEVNYIRVMSLHKSKGLTADHVIVAGFVQGLIPMLPHDDLTEVEKRRFSEEQRRLFYVAITRPRKTLVLSSVQQIPIAQAYQMNMKNVVRIRNRNIAHTITSDFISELGQSCPTPINGRDWRY
ncbi:MAG: AAA family ATPase [Anaerolineae bacterium]|nr:MAG: AAA family ATPase [Anaerolineae bacterium]